MPRDQGWRTDALLGTLGVAVCVVFLGRAFGSMGPRGGGSGWPLAVAELEQRTREVRRRPVGALAWEPVEVGGSLRDGDALYVPPDGEARVRFRDDSRLDIDEASLVVLERTRDRDARAAVELIRGGLEAEGTERLVVRAGQGRVVLDRSRARVHVGTDGDVGVSVVRGSAAVSAHGREVTLGTAELGRITPEGSVRGLGPSPVRLLGPAHGSRTEERVTLEWAAVAGAVAYEVEVAADAEFRHLVWVSEGTGGRADLSLDPGVYHWRVTARRADGEALRSERRSVRVHPRRAPVLLRPASGETLPSGAVETTFAWTEAAGAEGYRVEVGRDAALRDPVLVRASGRPFLRERIALDGGAWFWRAGTARADGAIAWAEPVVFHVGRAMLPPAPRLLDPTLKVEAR